MDTRCRNWIDDLCIVANALSIPPVGLSPATSATPVLCCQQVMLGTHRRLPVINRRKVGTTSSHHAPYVQGCTHATMASTTSRNTARWSKSLKACLSSDRSLQLDSLKLESLVIANQLSCGEYVLGVCTHRPSSHGSRQYPKPVVQPFWEEAVEGRVGNWD